MSNNDEEKSFWSTLPGILTGIAAIITAIAGLIIAFNSAGIITIPPVNPAPTPTPELPKPISVGIPLSAGWEAYGPGAVGKEYKDGILALNIGGEYDWAQLCLDLTRARRLPELERNPDGTYNLAKTSVIGKVRTDQDFKGYAYITLKDKTGDDIPFKFESVAIEITDVIRSSDGMDIFFEVPDQSIYKDIGDICLTFSFVSNETGSINVLNVTIGK